MYLYRVIALLFVLCGTAQATTYTASNLVKSQVATQSILANLTSKAVVNNQASFVTRAVNIGKSSIANAIRTKAFSPWGLAITAAVTAAGMLLDQQAGTVTVEGVDNVTPLGNGVCTLGNGQQISNVSFSWCTGGGQYTVSTFDENMCWFVITQAGVTKWSPPDCSVFADGDTAISPAHTATDTELYDSVVPNSTESLRREILTDPLTGLPDTTIPEIQAMVDDINADYDAANDADPLTEPTTDPATGDTALATESQLEPSVSEEDICQHQNDLVACMEVGDQSTLDTVPTTAFDYSYNPFSFSSAGSCPAPLTATASNGFVASFSYDYLCDFANGIKFIVIAVCTLIGLRMVSGVVRT